MIKTLGLQILHQYSSNERRNWNRNYEEQSGEGQTSIPEEKDSGKQWIRQGSDRRDAGRQISNWWKKQRNTDIVLRSRFVNQSWGEGYQADRVEGGGEKDLFVIYGMYKERLTEVDYWCGVGFNASVSCLWNGACVDGRGVGEISITWGCGAREPAALPEHYCVVLEERRKALEPQLQRLWERTEVGRSFPLGGSREIQRRSVLKRMWDKRREKGTKVEEEYLSNSQLAFVFTISLFISSFSSSDHTWFMCECLIWVRHLSMDILTGIHGVGWWHCSRSAG